jgi:5-formyltetrahydrofolate cyclo-ligase
MVKKAIRLAIRLRRKFHRASTRKLKDTSIIHRLAALEVFQKSKTILFYAPISHEKEVDTWPLIKRHLGDKTIVLPKITMKSKRIDLHVISDLDEIESNPQGIPEPVKNCKKVKPKDIDLAIIPGVAFDRR